jgi:hypothetical protein
MIENKLSKYHKYLEDLINIDYDFLKTLKEKKQRLAEEKEKNKKYKEDLKYKPIHDCLIDIMNDEELLEAVKKYGNPIKFAYGGGSHSEYTGYNHLELRLDSNTSEVNIYLVVLRSQAVGDLDYHRLGFPFQLYLDDDNKVKYDDYGCEKDAAKAIRHAYYVEHPRGIKKHNARSIVYSLKKAIKNAVNHPDTEEDE